MQHLKNHTQKIETKKDKLQGVVVSNSTPDFNLIMKKQKSPVTKTKTDTSQSIVHNNSHEQRISRKMAQTYLSGLSQGYITNMDNLKLLNN